MGWAGSFLLAATGRAGGWVATSSDDEDPFWTRASTLARLVEETGRPALVALCLDSDFLGVAGLSPDGTAWNGVVYRETAEYYREEGLAEGYDEVVPEFDPPEAAAAGAVAWAEHAGLLPDEDRLRRILSASEWTQPADVFWDELVDALGVQAE